MSRYDITIINRSFWPIYPVIGEALLKIAENLSLNKKVSVILQDQADLRYSLKKFGRGYGVDFFPTRAFSNSSSNLFIRVFDAIFFMLWVFFCLIRQKPKVIYISTDPPLLIPFIIGLISKLINAKFIYHLQDIHPEASNAVVKINKHLFTFLKGIDKFTLNNADILITISKEMRIEILKSLKVSKEVSIVENPSIPMSNNFSTKKIKGFSFTGNIGRLQRIPLLKDAIQEYRIKGGVLEFEFAGGGVHSDMVSKLAEDFNSIKYHGVVSSEVAANIVNKYEWAILPIEDAVTQFAFPSKLSSYVMSDAKILTICGESTSVAKWVIDNKVGIVIEPTLKSIVDVFFKIENNILEANSIRLNQKSLKEHLSMKRFVKIISLKILNLLNA